MDEAMMLTSHLPAQDEDKPKPQSLLACTSCTTPV
jgi:hypothetical protein